MIKIDDDSFLIQGKNTKVDLKYTNDTVFNGKERNKIGIGDKIEIWYSSQPLDSKPNQALASKIEFTE
ncbi:DUF3221 domain-containing protein [Saliterribacillus persicus]|uniref:DUF3221 domain-containing protein n=1 Tax=Saliterribacillus persicus TaxID=930114 RepID=UPI000DF36DC8